MIRVKDLNYKIGDFSLRDVNLHVSSGEYCVMLGKPGSGKTLLLECLAGLRTITGGSIAIDGRRVERAEPRLRGVGYVPQDYALFSTRSVRDNILFGLRLRGVSPKQQETRLSELMDMLGIGYLPDRSIDGLSGGERQRVALARALAIQPGVLLLDEPVSAVDEETRDAILADLKTVQRQTQTTTLHVCHNTREMQMVADKVAVMQNGRILQVGTPVQLRQRPEHPYVARLLRLGTIVPGKVRGESNRHIDLEDFSIPCEKNTDGEVSVLIRAGNVKLVPQEHPDAIAGKVQAVWFEQATIGFDLSTDTHLLRVEMPRSEAEQFDLKRGTNASILIPPQAVHVFETPAAEVD